MSTVHMITPAQDADAAYILNKIASADRGEAEAKAKTTQSQQDRIDAGLRLIEVRARFPDRSASGKQEFADWYQAAGLARNTVYNLMKLAGQTDTERDAAKEAEAKRKREKRAAGTNTPTNWIAYLQVAYGGSLPNGYNRTALSDKSTVARQSLEEACGFELPCTPEKFPRVLAALRTLVSPEDAKAKTEAEVEQLPEKMQVKFQRLVDERVFQAETAFWKRVSVEVKRLVAVEQAEAKEAKELYENLIKPLHGVMSKSDFRTIMSCLASDKQPESERAKFDNAAAIFNKLKPSIRW